MSPPYVYTAGLQLGCSTAKHGSSARKSSLKSSLIAAVARKYAEVQACANKHVPARK